MIALALLVSSELACGPASQVDRSVGVTVLEDGGASGGAGGSEDNGGTTGSAGTGGSDNTGGGAGDDAGVGDADAPSGDDAAMSGPGVDAPGPAPDAASRPDRAPDLPRDAPVVPDALPAPPELSRGRVGHWKLDEGMGNVAFDSSGVGNHGGTVNILGPDWVIGKLGHALTFTPARNTFLTIPSHPSIGPADAITISLWTKATSWAGTPRLLQKGDDDSQYSLRAENQMLKFVLHLDVATSVTAPLPPTAKWSHVAATYDGKEMRLYVDGSPVGMQTATGAIADVFANLFIGTSSAAAPQTEFFSGVLDDIIIYERALSAAEVRLLSEGRSP